MKPLIMFDFDGTLVDSLDLFVDVANSVAIEEGYAEVVSREVIREHTTPHLLRRAGVPFWKIPGLVKKYYGAYVDRSPRLHVWKQLVPVLQELREHAQLAIVSSNQSSFIESYVKKHDLRGIFPVVRGGAYFGKNRLMKRLMKDLGVSRDRAVYVGDELRDIHAARRARIACVAVSWGLDSEELLLRGRPAMLARTPRELRELLLAWIDSRV